MRPFPRFSPAVRTLGLTVHVAASVGWLGAVLAFLALSLVARFSTDPRMVGGAYLAMRPIGACVILPLAFLAFGGGVIQSLGTAWGLLRHTWVFAKLVITFIATTLLVLHQFTAISRAAEYAAQAPDRVRPNVGNLGAQLIFDAAAATVVLTIATALAIYKPWGLTSFAARTSTGDARPAAPSRGAIALAVGLVFLLLAGAALHHAVGGHWHHR